MIHNMKVKFLSIFNENKTSNKLYVRFKINDSQYKSLSIMDETINNNVLICLVNNIQLDNILFNLSTGDDLNVIIQQREVYTNNKWKCHNFLYDIY